MIEWIKDTFRRYKEKKQKAEKEELVFLSEQYCHVEDVNFTPFIVVNNVPLFRLSEKTTDMKQFNVHISDAENVIKEIRVRYIINKNNERR